MDFDECFNQLSGLRPNLDLPVAVGFAQICQGLPFRVEVVIVQRGDIAGSDSPIVKQVQDSIVTEAL